jgi:hypothetical protein
MSWIDEYATELSEALKNQREPQAGRPDIMNGSEA